MENIFNKLSEKISRQQKGKENTDVFMVGEQLKDICRNNSKAAELVLADLDVKEMSIEKCAKEIKEEADRLQKESKKKCICIPPNVAERIIRGFYGLSDEAEQAEAESEVTQQGTENLIRLEDFI